ncbi:MAG: hypothetical protein IPJ23_15390 [Ignavibacteriales bacterium]|nr:hypothetical protein [Ignavibacteriales bacterium]
MKSKYTKIFIPLLLLPLIINQCYPTYQATKIDPGSLQEGNYVDIQAKVFKSDNSIFLFPDGFNVYDKHISGDGIIEVNYSLKQKSKKIKLPLDSITAIITYEETTSGGRYFASFLLSFTAAPLTFLGIYCIACPKCCFGSCPTVYAYDGEEYNLEVELFSECISRQIEDNDIDLLKQKIRDNTLKLKITNEALETHFINKFEVVVAEHPIGTELFPSIANKLLLLSRPTPITLAVSKNGINLTDVLTKDDNIFFRSGVDKVNELRNGPVFDWIDIKVPSNKNLPTKMLVKYRNTLLSTTLLYDVVIGSQGVAGLEWTNKMNNDSVYASQFKMIYDAFSGIKIKLFDKGFWKEFGKFKDAGPLNWKYIAAELPESNSDTLLIRLEFIPDNFMIDYIAFDTTTSANIKIATELIYPVEVTDGNGNDSDSLLSYINNDDQYYLKTDPGDCYYLNYNIPKNNNCEQTFLIYSKGYYNEWIRGSWINNKNDLYTFNLYDVKGTLRFLADSWIENSELLEREFFHSKFSLKEEK